MRKHRASCNRAWVMLYLPAALCLLPGEVSSLRSSGREQRLVFWVFLWPFQQALGWCSSGLWPWPVSQSARCAPAARGPRAGAAVSMAAAILPVITELLKKQRLEFVLLLASVAPAGSEHVWCGAGELSPTGRGGSLSGTRGSVPRVARAEPRVPGTSWEANRIWSDISPCCSPPCL